MLVKVASGEFEATQQMLHHGPKFSQMVAQVLGGVADMRSQSSHSLESGKSENLSLKQ